MRSTHIDIGEVHSAMRSTHGVVIHYTHYSVRCTVYNVHYTVTNKIYNIRYVINYTIYIVEIYDM